MFVSVLLAAAIAAQPAVTTKTEMLGIDVPDEFQVGNHQRNEREEIIELVDPPETVDNWSQLITSLMFFGAAQRGAGDFYIRWRDQLRSACPGLKDTLVKGTVDGHLALRGLLSCPHNPQTGKPENLAAFLVQGDANMMMAQVAFRHGIGPKENALISRISGSLKVCDQRTLASCSARRATGFVPSK